MTQPLHIIAVAPPPFNGMTHVTSQMSAALRKVGPVVDGTVTNTRNLSGALWTIRRHAGMIWALLRAGIAGRRAARIYFVPDSGRGLWLNVVEAALMRRLCAEVWLHHHVFSYVRTPDRRMARILALLGARARHIVLTDGMGAAMAEHYGIQGWHVLGNGGFVVPPKANDPPERMVTVGFLGNITHAKGIEAFMDTIRRAQTARPDLTAVIAGPVADDGLRDTIHAFCLEQPETRKWLGAVYGDRKAAFLDRCDVLLFPSTYANEALPVTIYEALAAGVPVLATPMGGIPEQLAGQDWLIGADGFAAEAAARLTNWHDDPAAFAAAGEAARACFAARQAEDRTRLAALTRAVFAKAGA